MKKIILSLGSIATALTPIMAVVACGNDKGESFISKENVDFTTDANIQRKSEILEFDSNWKAISSATFTLESMGQNKAKNDIDFSFTWSMVVVLKDDTQKTITIKARKADGKHYSKMQINSGAWGEEEEVNYKNLTNVNQKLADYVETGRLDLAPVAAKKIKDAWDNLPSA